MKRGRWIGSSVAALVLLARCHSAAQYQLSVDVPAEAFLVLASSGGIHSHSEIIALFPDGRIGRLFGTVDAPSGAKGAEALRQTLLTGRLLAVRQGTWGGESPPDFIVHHLVLVVNSKRNEWEVTGPHDVPPALEDAINRVMSYVQEAPLAFPRPPGR